MKSTSKEKITVLRDFTEESRMKWGVPHHSAELLELSANSWEGLTLQELLSNSFAIIKKKVRDPVPDL